MWRSRNGRKDARPLVALLTTRVTLPERKSNSQKLSLLQGASGRRQEIEQWFVEEKISPWPSIRTVKTGWFYAGKAGDCVSGGEAKVPLEVWKADARALSEAHLRR